MGLLIDKAYFEKADMVVPGLGKLENVNKLNALIDKYEPEYLQAIFNYSFYIIVKEEFEKAEADIAQRFKDLRDGVEYTDGAGVTRKWTGFINDEFISPLAYFVFYKFLRFNQPQVTVSGVKSTENAKSVNTGPFQKQAEAWNKMVGLNHLLIHFLLNRKADGELVYPEFKLSEVDVTEYNNLMTKMTWI